jgi:hypothetical protein
MLCDRHEACALPNPLLRVQRVMFPKKETR